MIVSNLTLNGADMFEIRVFEYKRGETFSCKVVVNGLSATLCYNDITVPKGTPQNVKVAFLEEAERATLKIIEENEKRVFGV